MDCEDACQARMDDFKLAIAPLSRMQILCALQLITRIIETMEQAATHYAVDFGNTNSLPSSRGFCDLLARRNILTSRYDSVALLLTNGY